MPTEYSPEILQEYADSLYVQARYIMFWTAIKYGVVAFLLSGIGYGLMVARSGGDAGDAGTALLVGVTLFGIVAGVVHPPKLDSWGRV